MRNFIIFKLMSSFNRLSFLSLFYVTLISRLCRDSVCLFVLRGAAKKKKLTFCCCIFLSTARLANYCSNQKKGKTMKKKKKKGYLDGINRT